jgi:hypothetical protein
MTASDPIVAYLTSTARQAVETAWQQSGRALKSLAGWTSTRRADGTLLLTAQVTGSADAGALQAFASQRSPLLADYIKPGSGDTLPALDYPQPGRTALSWRTGGVWVELWHDETPAEPVPVRATPATVAAHAARRTPVPSARLPFGRLRNTLTTTKEH